MGSDTNIWTPDLELVACSHGALAVKAPMLSRQQDSEAITGGRAPGTLRFGSTANILAKCMLENYRLSECDSNTLQQSQVVKLLEAGCNACAGIPVAIDDKVPFTKHICAIYTNSGYPGPRLPD